MEIPEAVGVVLRCVLWLNSVDSFRETELNQLEAGTQETQISGHRAALCGLIVDGEGIVCFAKRIGWPESFKEFTLADVEATLESLHTSFNCQYRRTSIPQWATDSAGRAGS